MRFFGNQASAGSTGGITQSQLDAAVALLQDKATAATDAELSAAVATINTALGTKQASATAATDAELAAAVALLQDKATAATDSELASAVATINTALAFKQDAATAATDSELAAAMSTINAALTGKQDAADAATDAELAAAVSTLNTAIAAKQASADAATDAELASAVATINSAVNNKQDSATAATDSELTAAIATVNTAIGLKQDASTAATDTELSTAVALRAPIDSRWQASTVYKAGQLVTNNGFVYSAVADFTSGATFNPSNWSLVNPNEIASMPYSSVYSMTTTSTQVPGWQVVVPANSGPATIRVANVLVAFVTSTLGSGQVMHCELRIQDEASAMIAFAKHQIITTSASTQTFVATLFAEQDVPNNASNKTYSVWLRVNTVTNGAGATMHASASGFSDPQLKAIRR